MIEVTSSTNATPIDPTKDPIPEGMKVITCAKCGTHFAVPAEHNYSPEWMCAMCSTMPQSEGSKEAAATVAAALGQ